MDIIIYGYARPMYLELTLNSLCFNTVSDHNIHVILNKSTQNENEKIVLNSILSRYSNLIKTFIILDDNYFHNAQNCMLFYLKYKNKLSENICISEDDLIIPSYFKKYYGDFADILEAGLTKSVITGVRIDDGNYFDFPDLLKDQRLAPIIDKNYMFVGNIAGHFLTMSSDFYFNLSRKLCRSPFDSEFMDNAKKIQEKNYCLVLSQPVYHIGWNREMDYPEYYNELIKQRVSENWVSVVKTPIKKVQTTYFWENGEVKDNIELDWSWL